MCENDRGEEEEELGFTLKRREGITWGATCYSRKPLFLGSTLPKTIGRGFRLSEKKRLPALKKVGALTKLYSVYIPDLLFFGASSSVVAERSPEFQAECLAAALDQLGVASCTVVGFSYGGMVACKMAEARPDLVKAMVVSGSVTAMTDSISEETMERLGFSSSKELLLPENVKGLKALLKVATYKKLWFPDFLHRDYLKVMFTNRNERAELLEGLVRSNKDAHVPILHQRILLLWGENDNIFNLELAKNMKDQLGDKATLQSIEKAGHLVHLERPCVYTRQLKKFLSLVNSHE